MSRKNRRTRKFFADSKANVDTSELLTPYKLEWAMVGSSALH